MTLFIACLILYHFDSSWWLYVVALIIWIAHCTLNPTIREFLDN